MSKKPEFSRDMATFRQTTYRSSRFAFRDASYANAIERHPGLYSDLDVSGILIVVISALIALGLYLFI